MWRLRYVRRVDSHQAGVCGVHPSPRVAPRGESRSSRRARGPSTPAGAAAVQGDSGSRRDRRCAPRSSPNKQLRVAGGVGLVTELRHDLACIARLPPTLRTCNYGDAAPRSSLSAGVPTPYDASTLAVAVRDEVASGLAGGRASRSRTVGDDAAQVASDPVSASPHSHPDTAHGDLHRRLVSTATSPGWHPVFSQRLACSKVATHTLDLLRGVSLYCRVSRSRRRLRPWARPRGMGSRALRIAHACCAWRSPPVSIQPGGEPEPAVRPGPAGHRSRHGSRRTPSPPCGRRWCSRVRTS